MEKILNILNAENIAFEDLFVCVQEIKDNGNVFILKVDGESNINTIMIMFPNSDKEMIRYDNADLKEAMIMALKNYSQL